MVGLCRQVASTALAVMVTSAFPLAQAPAAPGAVRQAQQAPAPAAAPPITAPAPQAAADAEEIRESLRQVLVRHPPALAEVLRLDPALLQDAEYLAPYPELAAFLAQHPEVARNPSFYVGTAHDSSWDRDPRMAGLRVWENVLQGLLILSIFGIVTGVLVWLVKTIVDYRRWLRLTRTQTETHTKLLDRLTNQEDLIAYMQSPAGRRFLESAPITLDAASRPLGAPLSRVLWSVQAGVVVALVGIGVLIVSRGAAPEVAQGLWAIGILALALGAGFVLSAVVAYALSQRLGVFEPRVSASGEPAGGSALPHGRD